MNVEVLVVMVLGLIVILLASICYGFLRKCERDEMTKNYIALIEQQNELMAKYVTVAKRNRKLVDIANRWRVNFSLDLAKDKSGAERVEWLFANKLPYQDLLYEESQKDAVSAFKTDVKNIIEDAARKI